MNSAGVMLSGRDGKTPAYDTAGGAVTCFRMCRQSFAQQCKAWLGCVSRTCLFVTCIMVLNRLESASSSLQDDSLKQLVSDEDTAGGFIEFELFGEFRDRQVTLSHTCEHNSVR